MDVRSRRAFVRVDFNVPLSANAQGELEVTETSRLKGALPTLCYLMEAGAKCVLASHLGRPKGMPEKKYSLEPVGNKLSELLHQDVIVPENCVGDGPLGLSRQMKPGDVMLLENLRFHPGEERNQIEFARQLSQLCDLYISDAFGSLHRSHASISALPKMIPERGLGFLVQKELRYLEPLKEKPRRPFILIMGGAKVSDKMGVLENLMPKVDRILIGGAMAYPFLKAQGKSVGKSLCPQEHIPLAEKLLKAASARNVTIVLPVDHVVTTSMGSGQTSITSGPDVGPSEIALDIGPQTLALFRDCLKGAATLFWNGPMGLFEKKEFTTGTFELARAIASCSGTKLVGGGDLVSAIAQAGMENKFDFISTGGGATLKFLGGTELPGLEAIALGPAHGT